MISQLYYDLGNENARVVITECYKEKTFSALAKLTRSVWHKKWLYLDPCGMRVLFSKEESLANSKSFKLEAC